MEGAMDSRRLVLTRPTPRPVAARRPSPAVTKQPVSVMNDHVAVPVVTATPEELSRPQFSKLTPIYKSSPVTTAAKISGSRVKGIDFIQPSATTKNQYKVQPVVVPTPEPSTEQSIVSHNLEYLENNLDTVDLDMMNGSVIDEEADLSEVFGAAITTVEYQPVNFIEQYFQRSGNEPAIKHHIKTFIPKVALSIKKVNRKHVHRIGVLSILTGVIAFGGYVLADSLIVNQQAKAILGADTSQTAPVLTETPASTSAAADTSQTTVGSSEQPVVAGGNHAAYVVPADEPKYISIQKLGIHAPVLNVGLTKAGAVDTPSNIWDAAWYNGSAKPGTSGATLIDGHSSASHGALFGHLDQLNTGDQIQITRGDGSIITYQVAYKAIVNRNNVDMASMMKPYGNATSGLNIITCTGQWINSEKTLENRVLIYAQQI